MMIPSNSEISVNNSYLPLSRKTGPNNANRSKSHHYTNNVFPRHTKLTLIPFKSKLASITGKFINNKHSHPGSFARGNNTLFNNHLQTLY